MAYEQQAGGGTLSLSKFYEEGGNKPRHYGDILLSKELIDKIVANEYRLPISGWDKSGDGWSFISLAVDEYQLDNKKEPQQDPFDRAQDKLEEAKDMLQTATGLSDDVPF